MTSFDVAQGTEKEREIERADGGKENERYGLLEKLDENVESTRKKDREHL